MTSKCIRTLLPTLILLGSVAALAQKPYSVLTQWKIGGEGGWDYLTSDPAAHRLYVTHGPRVEVLNSETGKVVGSITGLKGTHGVALALRDHRRRQ